MPSILLLTAGPFGASSRGGLLATQAAAHLQAQHPALSLVERDLSALPGTAIDAAYAEAVVSGQPHEAEVFTLSETLIREVEEAAFLLIATPMHNYTVPAALKTWIDLVLRYGRSFAPVDGVKTGLLKDRPTLVLVTSGSMLTGAHRSQPDHLTAYVTDVLATIGIRDLRFLYLDGLVNPARAAQAIAEAELAISADPVFGAKQTA